MAAPMDGITDSPMRQMIRLFSTQELLFTEMKHVSCVRYEKENRSVIYNPVEQPLAFQFSANSLDGIQEAVDKVLEHNFVMINLNAGCPAKTVVRSGSGSALMAKIPLLEAIITEFIKAINNRVPFTLKMRAGYKEKNAFAIAQRAQELGVQALIIHPRTQTEMFASRPDFELVAQIKKSLSIPVIFSGNIIDFQSAKETYERTGVDGFMIGRALWGAPWKMKEIMEAADGKEFKLTQKEIFFYVIKHLELFLQTSERAFIPFKKHIPQYIRDVADASTWRHSLLRAQSAEEMMNMLKELYEKSH